MAKLDAANVIYLLESIGEVPRSYSGRSMYGKQCVAVFPGERTAIALAIDIMLEARYLAEFSDDMESVAETFRGAKTDSMGRGIVVYWPRVEWPAGRPESVDA